MSAERVLVVGPAWVGDMVMAQSLFKSLRAAQPDTVIDVVAPAWSVPLVARMAEVRDAHPLAVGHGELGLAARRRLGRRLRAPGYTRAIVLPRSFKAALVPFHARIPRRTGFVGEFRYGLVNDRRVLDKKSLPTTVARYVALGAAPDAAAPLTIPHPQLTASVERADALMTRLGLTAERATVALLPGAEYGPAKQWSGERFAQLAAALVAAGTAVWVFGSAKERALGAQICASSGAHNLCGDTELVDVVDLLARCSVAVSNDSGLMHVAAAVGCRVVAIYGSSSPERTPPLTDHAKILIRPQPCSPCFERTCRFGHYRCLTDIDVGVVQAAVMAKT